MSQITGRTYMLGALTSLLTSLFFAISVIQVRKGLEKMHFFSAILTVTIVQNLVFWPFTLLLVPLDSIDTLGIFFFILAGVFHPGLSRLGYYKGMESLGVSLNTSLIAIYPLFASIFAISLLNEEPTIGILAGMSCIVVGGILLERTMHNSKVQSGKQTRKHFLYPLIAGVFIGLGNVLRKIGLMRYNQILMGIASGSLVSLGVYGLIIISSNEIRNSVSLDRDSFKLVGKAGLALCCAWFFNFYALSIEEVTVVSSLRSTTPLFVLLFSYLFLKKLERLSLKMFIGTLVIILGVLIVVTN